VNRREMLKTVVGGVVAAGVCSTLPAAAQQHHNGVDLGAGPSTATFSIGSEGFTPLVITHSPDGIWRASRDGIEWEFANDPEPNWLRVWGSNGDCKMRICGDNIIEIEWLRFCDSPW